MYFIWILPIVERGPHIINSGLSLFGGNIDLGSGIIYWRRGVSQDPWTSPTFDYCSIPTKSRILYPNSKVIRRSYWKFFFFFVRTIFRVFEQNLNSSLSSLAISKKKKNNNNLLVNNFVSIGMYNVSLVAFECSVFKREFAVSTFSKNGIFTRKFFIKSMKF